MNRILRHSLDKSAPSSTQCESAENEMHGNAVVGEDGFAKRFAYRFSAESPNIVQVITLILYLLKYFKTLLRDLSFNNAFLLNNCFLFIFVTLNCISRMK